jgi:hypothetical protein
MPTKQQQFAKAINSYIDTHHRDARTSNNVVKFKKLLLVITALINPDNKDRNTLIPALIAQDKKIKHSFHSFTTRKCLNIILSADNNKLNIKAVSDKIDLSIIAQDFLECPGSHEKKEAWLDLLVAAGYNGWYHWHENAVLHQAYNSTFKGKTRELYKISERGDYYNFLRQNHALNRKNTLQLYQKIITRTKLRNNSAKDLLEIHLNLRNTLGTNNAGLRIITRINAAFWVALTKPNALSALKDTDCPIPDYPNNELTSEQVGKIKKGTLCHLLTSPDFNDIANKLDANGLDKRTIESKTFKLYYRLLTLAANKGDGTAAQTKNQIDETSAATNMQEMKDTSSFRSVNPH